MDTSPDAVHSRRRGRPGPLIFGAIAVVVGIFVVYTGYGEYQDAADRMSDNTYALENPSLAPLIAATGWLVFSVAFLIRQLVRPGVDYPVPADDEPRTESDKDGTDAETSDRPETAGDPHTDNESDDAEPEPADPDEADIEPEPEDSDVQWRTPLILLAALVGYVFVVEPVGFLVSTAVFFFVSVWVLGSKHLVRDGVIGVALSAAIYFGFTQLLGIALPALYLGSLVI